MKLRATATSHHRRIRAFTTVEMWTAAAVGVVLLGCGAYAYSASLKNASKSACLTHLHTIHTAIAAYANDNDGNLPPYAFGPTAGQAIQQTQFIQCLGGLGLTKEVWFCPSDSHAKTKFRGLWTDFSVTSYGMPPSLVAKGKPSDSGVWTLPMPGDSATVLLSDQPTAKYTSSHGPQANAVFGDGHVQPVSVGRL